MKIFFSLFLIFTLSFASDATIEVIKKVDSLPSIAIEDASENLDNEFKLSFFKSLVADLNVISLFNVDRHYIQNSFDSNLVAVSNKDASYVLRYKLTQEDSGAITLYMKLFHNQNEVLTKKYKIARKNIYMFIAHTVAYDINEYMGEPSVAWMKRKVVFSRMTQAKNSEIVIADYTLNYQHTIVKGGFNVFPKWANKEQSAFYFTALDEVRPTLKHIDIRTGEIKSVIASDGMMVCSDVSDDSNTLLLTMALHGQPDIYSYDVRTKKTTRLTRYRGIDVNGQFMGRDKIVFISNRLGYPNVFSKTIGSSQVEQMVYYGNSNSACSAQGEYVVYKARESSNAFSRNTFNLHLISTKTDFVRRLTATGINEYPRFSKDGDAILFIKNYKNQSAIGIIRLHHNKNYLFPLKYGKLQAMDW